MATDYISREAALKAICDKQRDHTHWKSNYELGKYQGANGYVEAIKSVPAVDVVEVVRCKDCAYYNQVAGFCEHLDTEMLIHDYCSDGYRRIGNG